MQIGPVVPWQPRRPIECLHQGGFPYKGALTFRKALAARMCWACYLALDVLQCALVHKVLHLIPRTA